MEAKSLPSPGQLSCAERDLPTDATRCAEKWPRVVLEVGTRLGGGGTLHILHELQQKGEGHLWGIEADRRVQASGIVFRVLRQRRFGAFSSGGN